ncbi:M20 family metallopeptidase [Chloroflexota bacterium]
MTAKNIFSVESVLEAGKLKSLVAGEVDSRRDELNELSLKIHDNPELGFHEVKAVAWLTGYLAKNNFSIEKGICDLPTAFRASYGRGKPVIAILAEYDALPKMGHACGHNLIAASAVGAGIASRLAVKQCGGSVLVIGTPAEELYGGKIIMADRGAFDDLDAVLMVHTGSRDTATPRLIACQNLDMEFFGKPAHAAARPEYAINALEAMIQSFTAINSLRQHIKDNSRVHGIITDGGEAANVVPAHSAGTFIVRAEDDDYLEELKEKVLKCFTGAATATGAKLEYRWADVCYASLRSNSILARLFMENMQSLGRKIVLADPGSSLGSSDIGNVSRLVPAIHPSVAIAPVNVLLHSPEFAEAAVSEAGVRGFMDAAKAMAMTVVDLLAVPGTIAKIKEEFERGK